ncbi:hypothetical protein SNL152K_82 [Streptomyces sp. NL15-2K]|nr:hypothetical protein SNL152K_82 [Streptomyces sp. NL15-2K]
MTATRMPILLLTAADRLDDKASGFGRSQVFGWTGSAERSTRTAATWR